MSTLAVPIVAPSSFSVSPKVSVVEKAEDIAYPDIAARFSLEDYLLRESMLAANTRRNPQLPEGFPRNIESSAVWSSRTLRLGDITYRLSSKDIEELEGALKVFNESYKELNEIARETFPLPSFGTKLRKLSWDVHEATGALILKGLQPDKYCLQDNIVIFAGLSSYIGDLLES